MDLGIDPELPHPPGDELRVLRTEVENQNPIHIKSLEPRVVSRD
jgi:hypothetical protein